MENRISGFFKGQFLVAMPSLADPNFFQTVTCICEHGPEGAVGIVVNRVHPSLCGKNIFQELKLECIAEVESIPIYIGGPVHINEIFVLHGPPFGWEGSLMITPSIAMSNTVDIIKAVAMGSGPKSFIITLGCAGWAAEQLESEIKENVWLAGPLFEEIIFDIPVESRWEAVMEKMGIDLVFLSDRPGHA